VPTVNLDRSFLPYLETLDEKKGKLISSSAISSKIESPKSGSRGVYLFSENGIHLYVGRSNDIKGRYGRHCNPGATHTQAAFAFKLAREKTGYIKASYKKGPETRKELVKKPAFLKAFNSSKERLRNMDFRFVLETDPLKQCLLEIYCATCLDTKYNDFDNH
jgi:hypothetical protein